MINIAMLNQPPRMQTWNLELYPQVKKLPEFMNLSGNPLAAHLSESVNVYKTTRRLEFINLHLLYV